MGVLDKNKKAYFEYTVIEDFVAGIKLVGSEIKPIKAGWVSVKEAYCFINEGELFIKGMHVSVSKESGKYDNHEPYRTRKLLMNKKEIVKLERSVAAKGMTIVPLNIHTNKSGLIKVKVGLCKGKKLYDKRQTIKKRDVERDMQRNNK
jgi:SsrA-binding protein